MRRRSEWTANILPCLWLCLFTGVLLRALAT